jgi:hypothetical protein
MPILKMPCGPVRFERTNKALVSGIQHLPQGSMKADTKSNKHIGPMAQDFYAAFGLGETDKYIAQGVAPASIQGLYHELTATKSELQQKDEKSNRSKTECKPWKTCSLENKAPFHQPAKIQSQMLINVNHFYNSHSDNHLRLFPSS